MRAGIVLLTLATLSYPFIVFFLLRDHGIQVLALPLCLMAALRIVLRREWIWGTCLLALAGATLLTRQSLPAKFYPVAVNLGLLMVFGQSLLHPPSVVERLARLREPSLPPAAVAYTRRVTQVWCGFFLVNAGICAWLAIAGRDADWALYCGAISYALAGLLFATEFVVRTLLRRKWRNV